MCACVPARARPHVHRLNQLKDFQKSYMGNIKLEANQNL